MRQETWWELFQDTGAPEAYLLYKMAEKTDGSTGRPEGAAWN